MVPNTFPYPINRGVAGNEGEIRLSATAQTEWLRGSSAWRDFPPHEWTPVRVLGAGANGLCGLWKCTTRNPAYTGPEFVVVKQVRASAFIFLQAEACLMHKIMTYSARYGGTNHVLKILREAYRDPGSNASRRIDPSPYGQNGLPDPRRDVGRMYTEYCAGGDLEQKMDRLEEEKPWQEEEVWRLLECLARSLLVLDKGSEDPAAPRWGVHRGMAHFDIKPPNIFIGSHDAHHARLPAFKLADFGLAMEVPPPGPPLAYANWIAQAQDRGSVGYLAPEQLYIPPHAAAHQPRIIGLPANIWSLGSLIHQVMVYQGHELPLQRWRDQPQPQLLENEQPALPQLIYQELCLVTTPTVTDDIPFYSYGEDLFETTYSKKLKELVFACLAHMPADRPDAEKILRITQEALPILDRLNALTPNYGGRIELGVGPGLPVPRRPPPELRPFTSKELAVNRDAPPIAGVSDPPGANSPVAQVINQALGMNPVPLSFPVYPAAGARRRLPAPRRNPPR